MQSRNPSHSLGCDLSHYQVVENWDSVKNSGISFVIIKSTEGNGIVDDSFQSHLQGAKSVGIKVGVYHFCRAHDEQSAIQEADFFISVINSVGGFNVLDIHPALDIESPEGASRENVVAICKSWIERVKQTSGMQPLLYSYPSFADQYLDVSLADIPLWYACYNTDQPNDKAGWTNWTFLQYTEKGQVPGIQGYVDLDEFAGNIQDYNGRLQMEDEENMALQINEYEWEMLNNVFGQYYNAKVITDWNWLEKIHARALTAGELAFLNCIIEAKKQGLSVEANSYGMK